MSPFAISEDLRGVLEDVVKEPKQRLFAGTCLQQAARGFDEIGDLTLTTRTGLSSAERHLLRVHKEELARALLFGFYYSFFAEGGPGRRLNLIGRSEAGSSWRRNAEFARNNALPEAFAPGSATWLHRLLKGQPLRTTQDYHELAVAAERLTGSVTARLYRGLNLHTSGKSGAAQGLLRQVARDGAFPDRHPAMRKCASIEVLNGDFNAALSLEAQSLLLAEGEGEENLVREGLGSLLILQVAVTKPGTDPAPRVMEIAADRKEAAISSLTQIADLHPGVPMWHGIACRILDWFDAGI